MTADIIPVDFKSKRRLHGKSLEAQAVEIINVALIGSGGIDDLVYETSMGWVGYPPPDEPEPHMVGEYRADYSCLTPQEIAQEVPELTELYADSVPADPA